MAFAPYPLRKDNPRNKLSPNVRWKQKMTLTIDATPAANRHGWLLFTWFLGAPENEDKMFWHTISEEDAIHCKNFLQIPFVATLEENDWTPIPSTGTITLAMDRILYARAEAFLQEREAKREKMITVEAQRAAHTKAGGNPHSFQPPVEDTEECAFCGIRTENPCLSLPPDMCEQALNAAYPLGPLIGKK